jgi:hypothetical protein
MSTLAESLGEIKKPWLWIAIGGGLLLVWGTVAFPKLERTRSATPLWQTTRSEPVAEFFAPMMKAKPRAQDADVITALKTVAVPVAGAPHADAGRKIIRTIAMDMVVQHPAETAEKITALAEGLGGYLVSAQGGGQNATTGTLTVRVPAERFEQARTEIRKLGLRAESEKIDAQDVSRQYVDQDANIRNLRAEESQYLVILKQARTVKDMLAVTERLSEVRGQIEQQQAEFNALSRQIETVAITVSLRTEAETKVFGLNWRPIYQLKLALRDGLDSVADYAATMVGILFYLPAVLLWVGTILTGLIGSWKAARWIGVRWFGWKITEASGVAK